MLFTPKFVDVLHNNEVTLELNTSELLEIKINGIFYATKNLLPRQN